MCENPVRRGALWTLVNRSSQAWQKQYCVLGRDGVLSFYDEKPKSCDGVARAQLDVRQFIVDPVDDASGKLFGRKHVLVLCPLPPPVASKAASTTSLGNPSSPLHHPESFARTRSASLSRQLSEQSDAHAHHHQQQQQQQQQPRARPSTMSRLDLNSRRQLSPQASVPPPVALGRQTNGIHRMSDGVPGNTTPQANHVSPPTSPTLRRPVATLPLPLSPRGMPAIQRSSVPNIKPASPPLPPPRGGGGGPIPALSRGSLPARPPITPRNNISFTTPRGSFVSQSQPVSMSGSNDIAIGLLDANARAATAAAGNLSTVADFMSSPASSRRFSRPSVSKSRSVSPPPKRVIDESHIPQDAVLIACKTDLDKSKWVKELRDSLGDAGLDLDDSDSDGEVGKRSDNHSLYGSQSPMTVSSLMSGGNVGVPDGHDVEYGDTLSKYRQYRTVRRERTQEGLALQKSSPRSQGGGAQLKRPYPSPSQSRIRYNTLPVRTRSMNPPSSSRNGAAAASGGEANSHHHQQQHSLEAPPALYSHTPSVSGDMSIGGSSGGGDVMMNGVHSASSSSGGGGDGDDFSTVRAHRGSVIAPNALSLFNVYTTTTTTTTPRNISAPSTPRTGGGMNNGLGEVTERYVHVPSAENSLSNTPRLAPPTTQPFFGRRNGAGYVSAPTSASSGDDAGFQYPNGFSAVARRSDPAVRNSLEGTRDRNSSLQHTPGHDFPPQRPHHKPHQESVANFFGSLLAGTPQAQFMDGERDVKKLKKELGIHQEGASLRPIKKAVSKSKRRFISDGFDLDLTYITDRIIAMGFPSQNLESVYRNSMSEIQQFFKSRHDGHYMIYNLCSERNYDISKFDGHVDHFPFDDHNCPAFDDLLPFCKKVDEWMGKDKKNVATFHCKAGKGRTGLMICVYLLHSGMFKDPEQALQFYGIARTFNGKGVTIPSQKRWVLYFAKLKAEQRLGIERPPTRKLILTKIRLANSAPQFSSFVVTCKSMDVKYSSKRIRIRQQLKSDESSVVNCGSAMVVSHDVRLEFVKQSAFGVKSRVFSLWFHTGFIVNNQLRLTKNELDKANKDKKMGEFWIELIFEDFEDAETEELREAAVCTRARLTEEMMDESESDPEEARELEAAVDGLSAELTDRELYGLCLRMRRELPEKNRSHKLRLFRRCIVGSEIITWLLKNLNLVHVSDAMAVAQRMLDIGMFHYVDMEPLDAPDFQSELAARIGVGHAQRARPSSSPSTLERPRAQSQGAAPLKQQPPPPPPPRRFENSAQFYRFPRSQQPVRPPRSALKKSLTGEL